MICWSSDSPSGVVVEHRVDEGLALHHDALPRVAEAAADADGQQDADEGCVEHEVAGLAQVAALGGEGAHAALVVLLHPVAGLRQDRAGLGDGRLHVDAGVGLLAVIGEAREPRGRAGRPRAHRFEVVLRARDDAADERDEQQDVDGREPRRRVDVEQLEVVEHRREVGVVAEVLRDAVRVARTLRHERAGDGRDREQQEQQDRRAHARELPPEEAQVPDQAEARRDGAVTGGLGLRVLPVELRAGVRVVDAVGGTARPRGAGRPRWPVGTVVR